MSEYELKRILIERAKFEISERLSDKKQIENELKLLTAYLNTYNLQELEQLENGFIGE